MMTAFVRAAVIHLLVPLAHAADIDPKFAKNLTLYHVNERSYPTPPVNMNTADLNGDMYFDLRTRGLPLECGPWRNRSFWSRLDCDNPEVADGSKLEVTKLVVEVDTRYADYANCNVDPKTGVYSCDFQDCPDNCTALTPGGLHDGGEKCNMATGCYWDSEDKRCETYGCSNLTKHLDCVQGYDTCVWDAKTSQCKDPPGPGPICNKSRVGFLNLSSVDWGRHSHHGSTPSKIDFWHGNVLSKTNGYWYATWAQGECRPDDSAQKFCSWRVADLVKKVSKPCSDAMIDAAIVDGDKKASWGARCFDKCPEAQRQNKTSECWIECFYANVLGPHGSSQLLNFSSPDFGIPLSELQAAWDKPFLPVQQGGCAALPSAPPTWSSYASDENALIV